MEDKNDSTDFAVVSQIISALKDMDKERQTHVIRTVATWLKIEMGEGEEASTSELRKPHKPARTPATTSGESDASFSVDVEMSPKQFILEKRPRAEVERLACLAYYLTHYRHTPQFKNIDLSNINTEAAQRKFSNVAYTVQNAVKLHYIVQGSKKGHKQLSADGEQIISALPDREAVAAIRQRMRPRKPTKRSRRKKAKAGSQ